jgi:hypothetical protein
MNKILKYKKIVSMYRDKQCWYDGKRHFQDCEASIKSTQMQIIAQTILLFVCLLLMPHFSIFLALMLALVCKCVYDIIVVMVLSEYADIIWEFELSHPRKNMKV